MGKARRTRVPVTRRALVQRINRALPEEHELHCSRGARAVVELGNYYLLDADRNIVVEKDVDIDRLGRSLGVLSLFEEL